jgi:3-methyladenine DNA glycosylase AlkD
MTPPGESALLGELRAALRDAADPARAAASRRFFKTGPGEYAEGDTFLGVTVPMQRALLPRFKQLPIGDALRLLASPIHEERLVALLLLVARHKRGDADERAAIHHAYLANLEHVNNWDLVDSSAEQLVGAQLLDGPKDPLYRLARSPRLWDRRVAMISTFHFIKKRRFDDALAIAELLLGDSEDLIHKAVGWMLRETGERDRTVEERFLDQHADRMPRTMLRYAIEKFPPELRAKYMAMGPKRR